MMQRTDELERELDAATTYMDCFKGSNLIRTEITIMVYLIQIIGGCPLIGYANYFFEQAGLKPADAFNSQSLTQESKHIIHSSCIFTMSE